MHPTIKPTTGRPSVPSRTPTGSPTSVSAFVGLDLYMFLDRSKSMRWRAADCLRAPEGNPAWPPNQACWLLWLRFVEMMVNKTAALRPTGAPPGSTIGWQSSFTDERRGLRVWLYAFACTGHQTVPVVMKIGEKISTQADFEAAINSVKNVVPDGGTCPGAAFQRALGQIMANDLLTRPKSAFLYTDGIFYDQPVPADVSVGFHVLGVLNYALGIAVAETNDTQGLKPYEIADQLKELEAFVGQDMPTPRIIQADQSTFAVLDTIAAYYVNQFPADIEANFPRILATPYWCGFTSAQRCLNTNPENFDSAKYCKWIPNNPAKPTGLGQCLDQTWCGWSTQSSCNKDSKYCKWTSGQCVFRFIAPTITPTTRGFPG